MVLCSQCQFYYILKAPFMSVYSVFLEIGNKSDDASNVRYMILVHFITCVCKE